MTPPQTCTCWKFQAQDTENHLLFVHVDVYRASAYSEWSRSGWRWLIISNPCTPWKFNIALKKYLTTRTVLTQKWLFRGSVKLGGVYYMDHWIMDQNGVCCLFLRGAALQETTFGTCPDCCMRAKSCVASHHKRASWRLKGYFRQMFGGKNMFARTTQFMNEHGDFSSTFILALTVFYWEDSLRNYVVLHRNSNVIMANDKITPHQRLIESLKVAMTAVSTKPRRCPTKKLEPGSKTKGKKTFHMCYVKSTPEV